VIGLLLVLVLVLLGGGGAFVVWQMRAAQAARAAELMAHMAAEEEAERARLEVERAQAIEQARQKERRVQDILRAGQPHPSAPCFEEGAKLASKGKVNEALLWFARGLEQSRDDANQQRLFRANLAAWGQPRPKPRELFRQTGPVTALALSPDGKTALTGGENGTARLWLIEGGKAAGEVPPAEGKVSAVGFGAGGKEGLVANGAEVRHVDPATGKPQGEPLEPPGEVLAMAALGEGEVLMCGTCEQGVWLSEGGRRQGAKRAFAAESPPLAIGLGPGARLVVTGHEDGTAQLWGADRKPVGLPLRLGASVAAVAVSPDGAALATAAGKAVRVWDAATRQPVGPPMDNGDDVLSLAFAADGKSLLTGDRAGAVRQVPLATPTGGEPERLKLWAEVTARAELDAAGKLRPLADGPLTERRTKLQSLGGPPTP
jgi:hypothetical protein